MLPEPIILTLLLMSCSISCLELEKGVSLTYSHEKDAISVQLDATKFKHSTYLLELFPNGCRQRNETVFKRALITSNAVAETELDGPYKTGMYSVLITPSNAFQATRCQKPCQPVCQQIYVYTRASVGRFQREASIKLSDKLNCREWQDNTTIQNHSNHDGTYRISIILKVVPPFQSCITSLNVTLWHNIKKCDSVSGKRVQLKIVEVEHHLQAMAFFDNLSPGNYCIRVYTSHSIFCDGDCRVKASDVINLPDFSSADAKDSPIKADSGTSHLTYILVGCAIFVVIVVAGSIFYCKKFSIQFPTSINDKGLTLLDLIELAKKNAQKLEVVLIYSPDFEEHCDAVASLFEFIQKSFGISSVRYDRNEESHTSINLHSWVESVITPKSNRVFLIVESEGAVLQEEGRKKFKLLRPENGDCLDNVFPYALQLLKSDARGCSDYKTVFVVNFRYTPKGINLNFLVRNRRYELPMHFFDLYCDLLELPKASLQVMEAFEETMTSKWEEENLINKIDEVSRIINSRPTIFKDSFVEQDLFIDV